MIETLHSVLTDTTSRDSKAVQANLVEQDSAGAPWYT